MKTLKMMLAVLLVLSLAASAAAEEFGLSDDPRLAPARESFEKALMFMQRGDSEYKRRAGLAQKQFEHAEDYFGKASFLYREIGERQGMDTSHEVAVCDRMNRKAHVMVNKSRKKKRRRGLGF